MSKVKKIFIYIRIRYFNYLSEIKLKNIKLFQALIVNGKGSIKLGKDVRIGFPNSPGFYSYSYFEARREDSELVIGNNVRFNNCASIICYKSIQIGDDCLFGVNLTISDSDGHSLHPDKRLNFEPDIKPIKIGRNVFVGNNVIITKGVELGDNTVVGTGAIVTKSFPNNVIIGGNPAKVIKNLTEQL